MVSTAEALAQDLSRLPPTILSCFRPTPEGNLAIRSNTTDIRQRIASRETRYIGMNVIPPIDQTLQHAQKNVDSDWTESTALDFVTDAFPGLKSILTPKTERAFFQGYTTKDYLDEVALPAAIGFRQWVIDSLPIGYHQSLELLNEVDEVANFGGLLRLYGGISIHSSERRKLPHEQMRQQVNSLLGSVYLATIVDLTRKPHDEETLIHFTRQVENVFPQVENVEIGMQLEPDKPITVHILRQQEIDQQGFTIKRSYAMRRFGTESNQLATFKQREKKLYQKMLKTMRNRPYPLSDMLGARFVIFDRNDLHLFVSTLRDRLPNWVIEKEKTDTPSPESEVRAETYFAWKEENPGSKIEVQIYWIKNNGLASKSSWIKKKYMPGSNDFAYHMEKLLHSALPWMFPQEVYRVNWNDTTIQGYLLDYANKQALQPHQKNYP